MAVAFSADEVFEIAMDIEKNGKAFYEAALACTEETPVKEIFQDLAEQEQEHFDTFKRLRAELPDSAKVETVYDPDGQMGAYLKALADSRVFTTPQDACRLAQESSSALDALHLALRFEKDTILFFQAMKEIAKPAWGQEKIDALIAEEMEHVRRINGFIEQHASIK